MPHVCTSRIKGKVKVRRIRGGKKRCSCEELACSGTESVGVLSHSVVWCPQLSLQPSYHLCEAGHFTANRLNIQLKVVVIVYRNKTVYSQSIGKTRTWHSLRIRENPKQHFIQVSLLQHVGTGVTGRPHFLFSDKSENTFIHFLNLLCPSAGDYPATHKVKAGNTLWTGLQSNKGHRHMFLDQRHPGIGIAWRLHTERSLF